MSRKDQQATTFRHGDGGYIVTLGQAPNVHSLTEQQVINAFASLAKAQCEYKASTHKDHSVSHGDIVSWAIGIASNECSDALARGDAT